MNDDQLLRYSRQIMLPEIGIEGQERLRRSRVFIFGLGGLGSPPRAWATSCWRTGIGSI